MVTKEKLKDLLQQNVLEIKFKKIDGSERVMCCSLNQEIVPISENKTPKKVKKDNDNVIAVWDLEKESFRSFRLDSLINYSIIKEGYEL